MKVVTTLNNLVIPLDTSAVGGRTTLSVTCFIGSVKFASALISTFGSILSFQSF